MTLDTRWMVRGACRGKSELFFLDKGENLKAGVQTARSICAICDVRTECLDYAIAMNESIGIWGGMGRNELRAERRRRQRLRAA